jgi:pilus assembly protein CpaB
MSRQFGGAGAQKQGNKVKVIIGLTAIALMMVSALLAVLLFSSGSSTASTTPATVLVEPEPQMRMVDVLVSAQDIEPSTALEPGMFRKESRPQVAVDPRSIKDFEEIKNQYSRSAIVRGEPLLADRITKVRPTNPITGTIPEGFRAVTISVDQIRGVEGWARPGARVDVMWISRIDGKPAANVIVQNARILSAERQTDNKSQPGMPVPSTVTLLVTADDAAKIQLASTTGTLTLNLRGDNDTGKSTKGGATTIDELLGGSSQPIPQNAAEGRVRIPGPNGVEEFELRDGKLVPVK